MNVTRLYNFKTAVLGLGFLFALSHSVSSKAQLGNQNSSMYPYPANEAMVQFEEKKRCQDEIKAALDAYRNYSAACKGLGAPTIGRTVDTGACMDKVAQCQFSETEAADMAYSDDEFELADCEERVLAQRSCGEMTSSEDFKSDMDSAKEEKKSAMEKIQDIMKEQSDIQNKLTEEAIEANQAKEKAASEVTQQAQEISQETEAQLKEMDQQTRDAFQQVQTLTNEIQGKFIEMNAHYRQALEAVAAAEDALGTVCLEYAHERYGALVKMLDDHEKSMSGRLIRSGSAANLASWNKKKKKELKKVREKSFEGYYQECINGAAAKGKAAKDRIAAAKRAAESLKKSLKEQEALILNQKKQAEANLKQVLNDTKNQKETVAKQAAARIQMLYQNFELAMKHADQMLAMKQQNAMREQNMLQQKMMMANQELMQASSQYTNASQRRQCAQRGKISERKAEKFSENFSKAEEGEYAVEGACVNVKMTCTPQWLSGGGEIRELCKRFGVELQSSGSSSSGGSSSSSSGKSSTSKGGKSQ